MALKNTLVPDSYSVVRIEGYNKHEKMLLIAVDIYTDITKSELLTTISYRIDGNGEHGTLTDLGLNDAPETPDPAQEYLVGAAPTGDFASFNTGDKVRWAETDTPQWSLVETTTDQEVYWVSSESKYYRFREATHSWVEVKGFVGSPEWNTYFDASNFDTENKNLMQAAYTYLKSTPEFENAVDA